MPEHSNQNGDRDPWGRPRKKTPPDLEEIVKNIFNKLFGGGSGGSSSGGSGRQSRSLFKNFSWIVIVGVALVIWIIMGIYVVSPQEEAVVTMFGRYFTTTQPGIHWLAPGIMSRQVLNVQAVNTFPYQAEMLTQDENIVRVSLAIQYQIINPKQFLFETASPIQTLQQATASALRQVIGHTNLDDILTVGRQLVSDQVTQTLNKTIQPYQTGLLVRDVTMQPATPPEAVTDAFDDAIKAREDKQRFINKAQAYARRVESVANGRIARLEQSAIAYKQKVVLSAKADVASYLAILKPYVAAPKITRERLYLQAMSQVLSGTTNIILDPSGRQMVYLPLDQLHMHQVSIKGGDQARPMPGILGSAWQSGHQASTTTGEAK